jgi:hypothetical protein
MEFGTTSSSSTDLNLSQLLNERSNTIKLQDRLLLKRWRSGEAKSFGAFTINERYLTEKEDGLPFDWVRRVDIGKYPRVACGSCHGSIFVADVKAQKILGEARDVHYSQHSEKYANCLDEQLRHYIYGEYDGGGVLDVAMFGKKIVASSGREGGVKIFKLHEESSELVYEGDVQALIRRMPGALPIIITCMKFDSLGRLYLGGSDGFLRIVSLPQTFLFGGSPLDSGDVQVTIVPSSTQRQPSPILSLDLSEHLGMAVTAHASGDAYLYSIEEQEDGQLHGEVADVWNPFSKSVKSHARSVTFASVKLSNKTRHAIVVGGGNGEVWVNDIDPKSDNKNALFINDDVQKFKPDHVGPVVSLASRSGGLVASLSQDGMMRISHAWLGRKGFKTPRRQELSPLYGIGGLKVWAGSVCIDSEGRRLVSDGFDDAVVVHDFSSEQ